MSLLIKSEQNNKAFIHLRDFGKNSEIPENQCHSPAVHCCYYSCLQKASYILKEFFPERYESIDLKDRSTHNHVVSHIVNALGKMKLDDKRSLNTINDCLVQLKTLRIKCDYSEDLIDDSELNKAGELLDNFHQTISKELNL